MTALASIVAAAILCSLLHELGHIVSARLLGARVSHIGFNRRGWYVLHSRLATPAREIVCALSGPALNLTLALLLLCSDPLLATVGKVNLGLALFNLLLPHSDGVRAWAEFRHEVRA